MAPVNTAERAAFQHLVLHYWLPVFTNATLQESRLRIYAVQPELVADSCRVVHAIVAHHTWERDEWAEQQQGHSNDAKAHSSHSGGGIQSKVAAHHRGCAPSAHSAKSSPPPPAGAAGCTFGWHSCHAGPLVHCSQDGQNQQLKLQY